MKQYILLEERLPLLSPLVWFPSERENLLGIDKDSIFGAKSNRDFVH